MIISRKMRLVVLLTAFLLLFNCISFGGVASASDDDLGNWTDYNGIVFGDAYIHSSSSGGALAVGGNLIITDTNYRIGSTYSAIYDATRHIGEYQNPNNRPALLFGGNTLSMPPVEVNGGDIAMTSAMHASSAFIPAINSGNRTLPQSQIDAWFAHQRLVAQETSQLFAHANDVEIQINDLSGGNYRSLGAQYFRNQHLTVDGEIYQNALFITVRTPSDVDFGTWWPVHSIINIDVNWAIEYDLIVFNFPDIINATMNSSTFFVDNATHWSTTVDAWIGDRGRLERRALAEKVVYNFPQAQSIQATHALIQGSILAPNADFIGIGAGLDGHIYGHLVVNNFTAEGNFTIHAFRLSNWAYDIAKETVEPSKGALTISQQLYLSGATKTIINGGAYAIQSADGGYFDGAGFSPTPTLYAPDQRIEGIPYGDYFIELIVPPDGFDIGTDAQIPQTYYRYALQIDDEHTLVTRYVSPMRTDVTLQKVDADTREGLAGAVFMLIREEDWLSDRLIIGTYTSDSAGDIRIERLFFGSYTLVEIAAPDGYELPETDSLSFEIYHQNGALLTRGDMLIENTVVIPENTLTIIKYAHNPDNPSDTSHPLGGAEYDLYAKNGENWQLVTTNALGDPINIRTNAQGYYKILHLPDATYRLVERTAPNGYELMNNDDGYAYEFTFDANIASYTAYLPNTPLLSDLAVHTVGQYLDTQTPLSGNVFKLEHRLGGAWEELITGATTDSNGRLLLERLTVGDYRLVQQSVTAGYHALDPAVILLKIEYDGSIRRVTIDHSGNVTLQDDEDLTLTIVYQAQTRGFTINKVDGDDPASYLEGALFRLQRRDTITAQWVDYGADFASALQYNGGQPVLDDNGNHIASATFDGGLMYGSYRIVEITPPAGYRGGSSIPVTLGDGTLGYQVNQFTVTTAMAAQPTVITHTIENYMIHVTTDLVFYKTDYLNLNARLKGAEFALYSCNLLHVHDEYVGADACWRVNTPELAQSNANGEVSFDELLSGEYLLVESRAPQGYQLPAGCWSVVVDALAGDTTIRAIQLFPVPEAVTQTQDEQTIHLVPNMPYQALPITGYFGSVWTYYIGGALLLCAAAVVYIYQRFQKK